jgi:N6-adenosine-specific RNA methylase IME4
MSSSPSTSITLGDALLEAQRRVGEAEEHSAKPDSFYDFVEQVSPGPYAELFSRRARFGWSYPIGDQVLGGVAA